MKTLEKSLLCGLVLSILLSMTSFMGTSTRLRAKVVRLHILANSNSKFDQDLKLKVRDAILQRSQGVFDGNTSHDAAMDAANSSLGRFEEIVQEELLQNGTNYGAHAELTKMYFTTQNYGTATLPAGNYDAVRVVLGEGKGKNWWCVLFPPLCLGSARAKKIATDVLSSDEVRLIEGGAKFKIKFKVVEIFYEIKNFITGLFEKTPNEDATAEVETGPKTI